MATHRGEERSRERAWQARSASRECHVTQVAKLHDSRTCDIELNGWIESFYMKLEISRAAKHRNGAPLSGMSVPDTKGKKR